MTTTTVDDNNVTTDDATEHAVTDACLIVNLVIKLKLYIVLLLCTFSKKIFYHNSQNICFTITL